MLRQPITYTTPDGKRTVTEDFYFDFNKLEVIEMLQLEDLEETIEKIGQTEDAKKAYLLFKGLVLKAYGRKGPDGRQFFKKDENGTPYSRELEASPALGELILSFLENPQIGAAFIQGTLPQHLLEEAKESVEDQKQSQPAPVARPTVVPKAQTEDLSPADPAETATQPAVAVLQEPSAYDPDKGFKDYTEEELLGMPDIDFDMVVGTDMNKMTKPQLQVKLKRMAKQ
jgi:hypothetical protein